MRTLPAFFGVLELLLAAGVTTVAKAAFQDHKTCARASPSRAGTCPLLRVVSTITEFVRGNEKEFPRR
jgi:hypothetical protein